jgi:hypothetical protein
MSKYKMSEAEKRELEEYRGTGLSPRQIKAINREAAKMREFMEFLKAL